MAHYSNLNSNMKIKNHFKRGTSLISFPITFLMIVFMFSVLNSNSQESKYLYLTAKQLKPLGIELTNEGLFYQNCNPKSEEDKKFPYCAFYSIGKTQGISSRIGEACELGSWWAPDEFDRAFKNKKITENDFYPLFVATNEEYNFISDKSDKELLPIAIRMEESKISGRTDVIVFWFKVTESLKKLLPKDIVIEDYLGSPDIVAE